MNRSLALAALLAHFACSRPVVNINTADVRQLTCAPGISEPLARAIIEHRKAFGPYRSVEGLQEVPVRAETLRIARPYLATYGETNCVHPWPS